MIKKSGLDTPLSRMFRTLSYRIFFILAACFVLPLLLYAVVLWDRDWEARVHTVFTSLELLADGAKTEIETLVASRKTQLRLLALFTRGQRGFSETLKQMASLEKLSTIFVLDSSLRCVESSDSVLIGKNDFVKEAAAKAKEKGSFVFSGVNPYTHEKEIFILIADKGSIWGLSEALSSWVLSLEAFEKAAPFPFKLSFSTEEPPRESLALFPLSALSKETTYAAALEGHALKGKDIGITFPLDQTEEFLTLTVSHEDIQALEGVRLLSTTLHLVFLLVLIGGLATCILIYFMAKPLKQLVKVMQGVKGGDLSCRFKKDSLGFEMNLLGENFNQMIVSLLSYMEIAKNERVAKEVLFRELALGHEIQKELFPKVIPHFPGVLMGATFLPAKEVAGDFYDVFAHTEEELIFCIADGSDKGISPCLYALMVRSMLRALSLVESDFSALLQKMNRLFCEDVGDAGIFVTMWVGRYHKASRLLEYHCAGHFPALLLTEDKEIRELTTKGIALGAMQLNEFEVRKEILPFGSTLVLYTDGVIEAKNQEGVFFTKQRLLDFLKSSHFSSPKQLIDELLAHLSHFSIGVPQHDDLTILSLKTQDLNNGC